MHIVELHRKLQENRDEIYPPNKVRIKTAGIGGVGPGAAAVAAAARRPAAASAGGGGGIVVDRHRDASELLELGVDAGEVSDLLGMPPSEVARIQEYNQKRRRFLITGDMDLPAAGQGVGAGISFLEINNERREVLSKKNGV